MKNKLKIGMGIFILTLSILAFGCKSTSQNEASSSQSEDVGTQVEESSSEEQMADVIYTCPMHPEIEQSTPGTCPVCGMNLEVKDEDAEHNHEEDM